MGSSEIRKIELPGTPAQQMRTIAMSMALDSIGYSENPPKAHEIIDIAIEFEDYIRDGRKNA